MDASRSKDADGDDLTFFWWQQPEIGNDKVVITNANKAKTDIRIPANAKNSTIHIICEVHDNGLFRLVSYRRICLEIK